MGVDKLVGLFVKEGDNRFMHLCVGSERISIRIDEKVKAIESVSFDLSEHEIQALQTRWTKLVEDLTTW